MFKVTGGEADFAQATLHGFFRSKIADREYPGIIPQQGDSVSGILYFDLSQEAIERLDAFEGEMYRRQDVETILKNGDLSTAMTYVIKPHYSDLLTSEEWSFSHFLTVGKIKFEKTYFGFQEI